MKVLLSLVFLLMMATQPSAEIYSWVDDSGTHNFTEDISNIPVRYRKQVNSLGGMENESVSQESPPSEMKSDTTEVSGAKPVVAPGEEKQFYNGKSREAWRQEFDAQEAELTKLEQSMDLLRKESVKPPGLSKEQHDVLKKEYDDLKATYLEKYRVYSELIESARKAGLTVEIKK